MQDDPRSSILNIDDVDTKNTVGISRFGRVKLGIHRVSHKAFVVKSLSKNLIVKHQEVEHVLAEKKNLEDLKHPFIVQLWTTSQDPTSIYFLLEFIPGGTLRNYLSINGRLANETARHFTAQIVIALEFIHSHNFAYRDLNPDNVMIASDGYIKLIDFGAAKVMFDEKKRPLRTFSHVGLPLYQAPEMINGSKEGHGLMVDWWSLGIVIFELLCGYPPFFDIDNPGIFVKILQGHIDYPQYLQNSAKEAIQLLLVPNPKTRSGALSSSGISTIRKCRWLRIVDWGSIAARSLPPPWVPPLQHHADTKHFPLFPASAEEGGGEIESTAVVHAKEAFRQW